MKGTQIMNPGEWYRDRWTGIWVQVVYGAQRGGYTTVRFPTHGNVVTVRTEHLESY